MALTLVKYGRTYQAAQYVLPAQADIVTYLQGIYGVPNVYLSGNTILNPVSALFLTDWMVTADGAPFARYTDADFQAWFHSAAGDLSGPLGFFGATPTTRPGTYTAGYASTTRAMPAYTPNNQGSAYTGGLLDLLQAAKLTDLNTLRVAVENLRALTEATAQRENALVNDLRTLGLIS